jgi:hypothetical protein
MATSRKLLDPKTGQPPLCDDCDAKRVLFERARDEAMKEFGPFFKAQDRKIVAAYKRELAKLERKKGRR